MAEPSSSRGLYFALGGAAAIVLIVLVATRGDKAPSEPERDTSAGAPRESTPKGKTPLVAGPLPATIPVPDRLVAIGDLHGDLAATRRVLRLAGAIDEKDHWNGGNLVVVQTGDEIDRGDDDRAILDLFSKLEAEAKAAGGRVVPLLGNHELMNAEGDFRYVTQGSNPPFAEFDKSAGDAAGRRKAFAPGGAYAKILSTRNVVAIAGDSVFVHGGVLPAHVRDGLERANSDARAWLAGTGPKPGFLSGDDGLVWTRAYSSEDAVPACAKASEALAAIGVKRMVVGHTVQKRGINAVCEGKVWKIDVGLAALYGGKPEVLEIKNGEARPLRAP